MDKQGTMNSFRATLDALKKLDLWGKDHPMAFTRKKEDLSHTSQDPPNPRHIRTKCPYLVFCCENQGSSPGQLAGPPLPNH